MIRGAHRRPQGSGEGIPFGPLAVALVLIALAAVLRHDPFVWIGDNRLELYDNPGRRVSRMFSLWDTTRGLGRLREEFWPGPTLAIGALRGLGLPISLTQHIWHGLLVGGGGVGMVALMRCWRPVVGIAHVSAALVYMFSPYSVAFLLPSNLYLNYAVAPWVLMLVYRGLRAPGWRYPAALALVVASLGNVEFAGLMFVAFWAGLLVLFAVAVEGAVPLRSAAAFVARSAVLCIGASTASLYKTSIASEVFEQRIRDTESTAIISIASSWAESFRGMGSWLLYVSDSTGPSRPQVQPFLLDDPVVLLTFAIPVIALLGLLRQRPERGFLAMLLFVATLLMVGSYAADTAPPVGRALSWVRESVPQLSGLRNNFKAGTGLMIATAALFGGAVDWAWSSPLARRMSWVSRWRRPVIGGGLVILLVVIAQPWWRGPLYNPTWELDAEPAYVAEFTSYIDEQPGDARVLVLPGSTRNGFRWGWVNDDYLDARITRPHTTDTVIELSRPVAADLLHALDQNLETGYVDGLVPDIARRIGADLVVIRNDHRWEQWGQPMPAELDPVRSDGQLELVATFGDTGEFTASGFDRSPEAARARELPPVEVYRVVDSRPPVGPRGLPGMFVAGAGNSYESLAAADLLDGTPIRYTAETDTRSLTAGLNAGVPLVITDGNRRTEVAITLDRSRSYTLAAGEVIDRDPVDLFELPGSQTVVTFGDASLITSTETALRFAHGARPGLAVDGVRSTSWSAGVRRSGVSGTWRVEFEDPVAVDGIEAHAALGILNGPRLVNARVTTSTGQVGDLRFDRRGAASLDLVADNVSWIEIRMAEVQGELRGSVGLAEVEIGGVDLGEWVDVPTDAFLRGDAELDAALADAPISWVFRRNLETGEAEAEARVMRRFVVPTHRSVTVRGTLGIGAEIADATLGDLVGADLRAASSERLGAGLSGAARLAIDGDFDTTWQGAPVQGAWLNVRAAPVLTDLVEVLFDFSNRASLVEEATLSVGSTDVSVVLPKPNCTDAEICRRWVAFDLPVEQFVDDFTVRIDQLDARGVPGRAELPVIIPEVRWEGSAEAIAELSNRFAADVSGCIDGLIELDGVAVGVRLDGSVADVLAGSAVVFEACDDVALEAGTRLFASKPGVVLDHVTLGSTQATTPRPSGPTDRIGAVEQVGASTFEAQVLAGEAASLFTIGQSWDPGWRATIGGVALGPPISVDTQASWLIPANAQGQLTVRFGPERAFDVAVTISLAFWILAAVVLLRPATEGVAVALGSSKSANERVWYVALPAALLIGFGLGEWPGLALAAATILASRFDAGRLIRLSILGAVGMLGLAAVATTTEGLNRVTRTFADDRPAANSASLLAGLLLLVGVVGLTVADRRSMASRSTTGNLPSGARTWFEQNRTRIGGFVVTAAVAVAGRLLMAPPPLDGPAADVARNVELGAEFGRTVAASRAEPSAWVSPLGPLVRGLLPWGGLFWLAILGVLTAMAVGAIARRVVGPRWAVMAALVYSLTPTVAGQRLPEALAAAAVAGATLLALSGSEARRARPLMVGVLLALGALARAEVLLLLLGFVGLVLRRKGRAVAATVLVGALLTFAPWSIWVNQQFEITTPTTSALPSIAAAAEGDGPGGFGARGAIDVPLPSEERAVHFEARRTVGRSLGDVVRPDSLIARTARGFDLWRPDQLRDGRSARGEAVPASSWLWPFDVVVALGGLVGALGCAAGRIRDRDGERVPPYFLLPIAAFVVVSAVVDGSAALRSWTMPALVVSLVIAAQGLAQRRKGRPGFGESVGEVS